MAPSPITHSLCLSPLISLFSLPSPVIFLFHSLRQLPSPTCPQAAVITLSSPMRSCQSPCYFFPLSYLSLSSVLPPPGSSRSLRSPPCWLHIVFMVFFLSLVKDLDTEKYVHLVSTLQKLLKGTKINHGNIRGAFQAGICKTRLAKPRRPEDNDSIGKQSC